MLGAALIRARQLLALKPGERLRDRLGSWLAAIANGARLLVELIRQAGTLIWRGAIIVGVIWFVFTDPFGWQLTWSDPGIWLGAIEIGLAILCLFCFRHFSEALFMLLVLIIGQPKRRLAPEDLTVAGGRPADPTEAQDFANRQRRHQPPPQFEV